MLFKLVMSNYYSYWINDITYSPRGICFRVCAYYSANKVTMPSVRLKLTKIKPQPPPPFARVTSHGCRIAKRANGKRTGAFAPSGCASFPVQMCAKSTGEMCTSSRNSAVGRGWKKGKEKVPCPFKNVWQKSPYDPRAPITNSFSKSSLCIFVCLNATAARGEKRLRIRQKLEKCDNSAAIFMARGNLVRQELFWDSSEPRDAGSKW